MADYLHKISRHRIAPPPVTGDVSAADLLERAFLSYNGGRLRELSRSSYGRCWSRSASSA